MGSESASYLFEVALGRYSSGLLPEWGPRDGFNAVEDASRMSPTAALSWIKSQGYPLPVLDSTLISRKIVGVIGGGVMLIVFVQVVRFRLVER